MSHTELEFSKYFKLPTLKLLILFSHDSFTKANGNTKWLIIAARQSAYFQHFPSEKGTTARN